ncbi:hypothetical protein KP509_13G067300 [Ceratopteris richardii]|uniref:Bifunctional inhibitor/plant lipid transfer protein/seed storage helical domain-containing protein n=1 Tax=Ceratopteris richardii TaxID=49495 RepID=A0A8T2TE95_CERRI|nr:hypothetical protein KP509_13G067300 [Ceratopteris richardii]
MSALTKASLAAVVAVVFLTTLKPGAAIMSGNVDCNKVQQYFTPCAGYLFNRFSSNPSPGCCASLRSLNAQSKGPVRQGVCECLKRNAASFPGLIQEHATSLSTKCGIPLNTAVSLNADCRRA